MIQTSNSSVIYVGNNSTEVPYPVPFLFLQDEHLTVILKYPDGGEFPLQLNTDYTVTGKGNPDGGYILTIAPVPPDVQVAIYRIVPMTQLTSYEEGDSFPAKSHERALDKLTMVDQQLARGAGTGDGTAADVGTAFRVTTASGSFPAVPKKIDTSLGIGADGKQVLRTPTEMLSWLGQVGTVWTNDATRLGTRGAYAGQVGVQLSNWTIYIARSTSPGDWVPHLRVSGLVTSTDGVPGAMPIPAGDIVGTEATQTLANKTFNNCIISNPIGLSPVDVGLGNVNNTADADKPVSGPQQAALDLKQNLAEKGVANGYASLDASIKVPIEQIPASLIGSNTQFKGVWNATTNVPTIPAAAAGNNGWYYIVNVAGSSNPPGASLHPWAVGDTVISDGTAWKKVPASQAVSSVAGKTGAVTLVKGDVGLGNVDNTSDATKNSAAATLTNKVINGAANTLTVRAANDITGNLPVARLNNGSGAASNTWWCGDGTWKQPSGTGNTTGAASSAPDEAVFFTAADGKNIGNHSSPTGGFVFHNPAAAAQIFAQLQAGHIGPDAIHGLPEKEVAFEEDELLIWDSATNTMMRVKKKNLGVPAGTICSYAGSVAPAGWLLCDAKSYLRVTYPALFSAIGTTWGSVDATHFSVPDGRGMIFQGPDNMGGTDANRNSQFADRNTIGKYIGESRHVLTVAELASHAHSFNDYYTTNTARGNIQFGNDINQGGATTGNGTFNTGSNGAHNTVQLTWVALTIIKY